ncbi:IS1634 family transposase [Erysipelotrichaceae bacterium RD49]|nr:IS1634 family transposase [Erysipelotrichaceae bacterium RD49]
MKKYIDKNGNIYVRESYRVGSKTSTRKVCKLGKVSDLMKEHNWSEEQVLQWVDQTVKKMTAEKKEANQADRYIKMSGNAVISPDSPENSQVSLMGGYLFLQSLLSSLGLPKILVKISEKSRSEFNLSDVVCFLVYSQILNPGSKRHAWTKRESFLEKWDFELHDVYRALDLLGANFELIQQELFKSSHELLNGRNTEVLYYDCTNFYFEIEEQDLTEEEIQLLTDMDYIIKPKAGIRRYGVSKEHRPNPLVQMGLFIDSDDIPVRMSIFPGNQSEQISINRETFNEIHRKYKIGSFVYCADGGLGSNNIKKALKSYSFPSSYIVTQSIKKLPEDLQAKCLDLDRTQKWKYKFFDKTLNRMIEKTILFDDIDQSPKNGTVYYREIWRLNNDGEEERLIVTYSPKYAHYLKTLRQDHIRRALKKLKQYGNRKRATDPARLISRTDITKDGEVATLTEYEIDEEKIAQEEKYDGFYSLATQLEGASVDTILAVNKQRYQIEMAFRILKTNLEARPVYVRSPERIKGHFLICFIALLVVKILEKSLDNQYTLDNILDVLRDYRVTQLYDDQGYSPTLHPSYLMDDLVKTYDLPLNKVYLTKDQMEQIIKKSKKKRKLTTFFKKTEN